MMETPETNTVAIVLLNYNNADEMVGFMRYLREAPQFNPCRIVVVDNQSTDDSAVRLRQVAEQTENCTFIPAGRNSGYAAGNNIGIRWTRAAGCAYAWVINSDIAFPDPDVLDKLMVMFGLDSSVACVSPKVVNESGAETNRQLLRPSVWNLSFGLPGYRNRGRQVPKDTFLDGKYCVSYRPQGCCMLVDVGKLDEVGDMDETTFLYAEEMILAEKLRTKGYTCACCLDTRIIHYGSATVRRNRSGREKYLIRKRSLNYYYSHYRGWGLLSRWLCNAFSYLKWRLLEK